MSRKVKRKDVENLISLYESLLTTTVVKENRYRSYVAYSREIGLAKREMGINRDGE